MAGATDNASDADIARYVGVMVLVPTVLLLAQFGLFMLYVGRAERRKPRGE